LKIVGFDRFNSSTINTDEDLLNNLSLSQISPNPNDFSNTFSITQSLGKLCFSGFFIRNQFPMDLDFSYKITCPLISRLSIKNSALFLALNFRSCDIGDRLTETFECVPCLSDSYSFESDFTIFSENCKSCFSMHFYCFGGGNLTIKPGYWRANIQSEQFYLCPNQLACLGDSRNYSDPNTLYLEIYSASYCEIGYQGVFCSECQDGYGFLDGHICSSCQNQGYYLQIFGNLLLRFFFTIYMIHISINMALSITAGTPEQNRIIESNLLKIFINHMQILGFILTLPISFPNDLFIGMTYFLSISPNISDAFSVECVLKAMGSNVSLQYFKLTVAAIYPFVLMMLFVLLMKYVDKIKANIYKLKKAELTMSPAKMLENHSISNLDLYLAVLHLVLLICYADIAKMNMAMFGCVKVDFGDYQENLLYVDFRIDCDSSYHTLWIKKLVSPIMVFFLFGYPIYIILSIFFLRNKSSSASFKFKFSYFYYAYEPRFFYWDFVILLRKLTLIFINSFFFSRITDQVNYYPILIVIIIFAIAFGLQVYCKPFSQMEFNMINGIEEYSLLVSFYTVVIAFTYMITSNLDSTAVLGLLMIGFFLNVSFFVFWIRLYIKYHYSLIKIKTILIK